MSPFAAPVTLQGQHVTLVPLAPAHHDDLVKAVQDGELWNHWYTAIPRPEAMAAEIARRLDLQAKGSMCAFAVIDPATGLPVPVIPVNEGVTAQPVVQPIAPKPPTKPRN